MKNSCVWLFFLHLSNRYSMYFTFHVQILEGGNLPTSCRQVNIDTQDMSLDLGLFSPLALLRDI